MIDPRTFVRKQTLVSVVISMAISAVFFVLVFHGIDTVAVWSPDNLALDFLPQSGLASFMAALMPALQARSAIAKGQLPGDLPSVRSIAVRALLLAGMALLLAGAIMALLKISGIAAFPYNTAFAIKVAYGAFLGLIITPPALRAVLPKG
jgi:hypothetical protein